MEKFSKYLEYTVSPLHMNFQVANFVCSHVQSCKLVHESGIHCHMTASSTHDVLLCSKVQWYSIFISSPHKSSGDVVGDVAKKLQAIMMESKGKIIERVERGKRW